MGLRVGAAFGRTRIAALPGVAILLVLWLVTWLRWGDYGPYSTQQIDFMWQSLGRAALRDDPIGSLLALHVQPPGFNALLAVDQAVTPDRHLLLLVLYLALAVLIVVLIVDTLIRCDVPGPWAAVAGAAYALLPSAVIYPLWPYIVTPVAALSIATVWGIALMRTRPRTGAALSSLAALGLVLIRPSFAWFVLLAWCALLTVLLVRRVPRSALAGGLLLLWAPAAVGVAVQAYYWAEFRLPTMSSWSGENIAKALWTSGSLTITEGAERRAGKDPCLAAMLAAYREDRLNRWDDAAFRGLPECRVIDPLSPRGVAAWDLPVKAESNEPNLNYADRLVASRKWTELMTIVVREDPAQVIRMAVTNDEGVGKSGIGLYLRPAEDYPFVFPISANLPTAGVLLPWSYVIGPLSWLLIIAGWVQAAAVRRSVLRRNPAFWMGSGLLVYHLLTNVLLEYSENMRYRAEVEPVLVALAVMAVWGLWRGLRQGEGPR